MNDLLKPFSLEGRVALVTGASSGFGRHFAALLSRAGAKVVVAARRTDLVHCVSAIVRLREKGLVTISIIRTLRTF